MLKIYDKLWDENATTAMGALVGRGDMYNVWEIANKAYDIANAMADTRHRLIEEESLRLKEQGVNEGINDSTPDISFSYGSDVIDFSSLKPSPNTLAGSSSLADRQG